MSDLDGTDAFDKVLDQLLEATKKGAAHPGELAEVQQRESAARAKVSDLQCEVATLQGRLRHFSNAEDAFTKLYDAIDEAVKRLRLGDGESQNFAAILNNRMVDAKKFIDPIPF